MWRQTLIGYIVTSLDELGKRLVHNNIKNELTAQKSKPYRNDEDQTFLCLVTEGEMQVELEWSHQQFKRELGLFRVGDYHDYQRPVKPGKPEEN